MAFAASPAAAEPGGESLPDFNGIMSFPKIESSAGSEEYSWQVTMGPRQTLRPVDEGEAVVEYEDGEVAVTIKAPSVYDANGTAVPTTLEVAEGDVITLVVHHREGAYVYPVQAGEAPVWGASTSFGSLTHTGPPTPDPDPEPGVPAVDHCKVPALAGLTRRAAANRLRAAHCSLGVVHAPPGAGAGKVVKQFHFAGSELPAGAPVAVKLGPR
jgi:hypothetical protein